MNNISYEDLKANILKMAVGDAITVNTHQERMNAHQIAFRSGLKLKTSRDLVTGKFMIRRVAVMSFQKK